MKKRKAGMRIASLICALPGWLALVGCSPEPTAGPQRDLAPGAPPDRIVVMAPAAAEMLDALGGLERIVGIGDFVREPESIADLPRVGAYDAPSVERVLELRADLYVTSASRAGNRAHARLESLGVKILPLDTSTYDGVFAALSELGRAVDKQAEARAVVKELRLRLRAIERQAAGLPARRVLFVVGRDPIFVAGPGSHIDEMISMVGGVNVAHDTAAPYQRLSMEAVLERMPDVIIDTSDNRPDALRGRANGDWQRWEFLPAVRDGRVYWVDPSRLVIPGMRLPEMTLLTGKLIHPEVFGEASEDEFRG